MHPRMLIVVEGTVKAIYTAGGMPGGVAIRSTATGDHPGVNPEGISDDFMSVLEVSDPTDPDFFTNASKAAIEARERGVFGHHGEIVKPAVMFKILASAAGAEPPKAPPEPEPEPEPASEDADKTPVDATA